MKLVEYIRTRKIATAILASVFCIFAQFTSATTITIVADEWPPYNGVPDSSNPGYGIEIMKKIFEPQGYTIEYKVMPWSRALIETRAGHYNAVIGLIKDEAPDFITPEEEFGVTVTAFYVLKDNPWKYDGTESLVNMKVGLIKGYSYGKELDAFFKKNQKIIQYAHGDAPLLSNIKKLLSKRIDVIVEDPNVFCEKSKSANIKTEIINAGQEQNTTPLYIGFSPELKDSKKFAELFTAGIKKLKESGELQKILNKYSVKYWK